MSKEVNSVLMKKIWGILLFFSIHHLGISQSLLDSFTLVNPIGHTGWITCAKIRNNVLYTGSTDKTIKLWDLKSMKEIRSFTPTTDVVGDLDVTLDGRFIVSAYQRNYIIIQAINGLKKRRIDFSENQICESAFFAANDSLIIVPILDSLRIPIIKVYDFNTLRQIKSTKISASNDNFQLSADKKSWFYILDQNSVAWNSFANGKVLTKLVTTNFKITNYSFDDVRNQLIVYGQNKIAYFDKTGVKGKYFESRINDTTSNLIDLVIPLVNEGQLVFSKSHLLYRDDLFGSYLDLGLINSNDISYSLNVSDSTVFISADYLFQFHQKNKKLDTLFKIGDTESVNLFSSEYYYVIQGAGLRVISRNRPYQFNKQFSNPVKEKYNFQLSQNGELISIQNSVNEIEVFALSDFTKYNQITVANNILTFRVLNNGNVYILNELNNLELYVYYKGKYLKRNLNFDFEIVNFTIHENLNQIWLITSKNVLIKYSLIDFNVISMKSLPRSFTESTILSDNFNSFLKVRTDNYTYCELEFGELGAKSFTNKIHCSTGVTEGAFAYGISEDGSYVSYIDETNSNLLIADVKTNKTIKKIDISSLDEILDVTISDNLNLICFSTFDDSVYCYNLKSDNSRLLFKKKYSEVVDLKIDEVNKKLLLISSDGKFYLSSLLGLNPLYSMYALSEGGFFVKLENTPFFMCSKNASHMLHYTTPSFKLVGFDQFDPIFNRPDIVLERVGNSFGRVDKEIVSAYRSAWERRVASLRLNKGFLEKGEITLPVVDIIGSDTINYYNRDGSITINLTASDSKYNLSRFNIFVNEVPLYGSLGVSLTGLKKQSWDTTITIPLSVGENKIQASVSNELGVENFKYSSFVNYTPEKDVISKTYFIGIGVNLFLDSTHNLNFCTKDIMDLASVFSGPNTVVKLFSNSEVTRENILKIKDFLSKTSVNDKVIVSCSSHGLLDDSLNFYLATYDIDFKNPKQRGLKYEDLENLLDGINARQKILFLDACNSGENDKIQLLKKELQQHRASMDSLQYITARGEISQMEEDNKDKVIKINEVFVNVRNNTGSVIISAAGGQESALEAVEVDGKEIENGAFTYSVLEYFKNNKKNKTALTVNKLKKYVENRVGEITNGKQTPTSRQENMEVDWFLR